MTRKALVFIGLLAAALWLPLTSHADAETPINSYSATYLGTLGGSLTEAYGINDAGQVVGRSLNSGQTDRAFLWENGVMSDLGVLQGGVAAAATSINNGGRIVGWSRRATGDLRAFLREPGGEMRDLGHLGGAASAAWTINDAGQVAGWSRLANGQFHAFLWQGGRMHDLGLIPGAVGSIGLGINGSGQVAGGTWDAVGNQRAFRWNPSSPNAATGTMVALSPSTSEASGLSDAEEAVGWTVGSKGELRPTLWNTAGAQVLPLAAPEHSGQTPVEGMAKGINGSGYIIGTNRYSEPWFDAEGGEWILYTDAAVTWDRMNGVRRLSTLLGYAFSDARAVNATGQIAGNGYLLNPSPLPVRPWPLQVYPFVEDGRVSLYWAASNGAVSYRLKRATTSGGPYSTIAVVSSGSRYSDTAVLNGGRYYYVVSAVNGYGESAHSNEAVGEPQQAPDPPTGLSAAPGDQLVTLSWNVSPLASYYKVHRSTTPGGPFNWFIFTYETNCEDRGDSDESTTHPLNNGTRYYYVVTAVNGTGESGHSNEASAVPMPPAAPPTPTGLTATAGENRVSLAWTQTPRAAEYRIKRSTQSGGSYTEIGTAYGSPSFIDNYAWHGTTYFYVVSAANSGGESPNSAQVSASPLSPAIPAAPTSLAASGGKKRVDLKWKQSTGPGVTQNRVYRSKSSSGGYNLRATISARTAYSDTGLASGVRFYYVVTAVTSSGKESAFSNQATAKTR